jgi:hypothetical protein
MRLPIVSDIFLAFLGFPQALPCGAPQFLGRTVRTLSPLTIPPKSTVQDLRTILEATPRQMCMERTLTADIQHTHLMDCCALASEPAQVESFLSDCPTSVLDDDCESSAYFALLCRTTVLGFPESPTELQPALQKWALFDNFTSRCFSLLSQFCNRGVRMLKDKTLLLVTTVGLATGASAADVVNKKASYNGHCFNIGCVTPPDGGKPSCFILEGTASMKQVRVTADSPKVTVKIWRPPGQPVGFDTHVVDMPTYLTLLGQAVSTLTQVINAPNGGRVVGGGWPVGGPGITGWLGSQMVMHSLDSDPSTYLSFYNRIMYMGWPCSSEGRGCMPVQTAPVQVGTDPDAKTIPPSLLAGCHPYALNDCMLRAVDATIQQDKLDIMGAIMNEATSPMVDHSVFKRLSTYWAPCVPLSDVNVRATAAREHGVEYVRVACMETPGIPELAPLICQAKRELFKAAQKINDARPDSDGARFLCEEEAPFSVGTGCHCFIDVPQRSVTCTAVDSLRQGLKQCSWPGYVAMGSLL